MEFLLLRAFPCTLSIFSILMQNPWGFRGLKNKFLPIRIIFRHLLKVDSKISGLRLLDLISNFANDKKKISILDQIDVDPI